MESHDREAERVMHSVNVTPEMKKSVIEGQVMFRIKDKKTAPETESVQDEHQPSVVSSADGAKILKDLDIIIQEYDKNKRPNTFLRDLAKVLGAKQVTTTNRRHIAKGAYIYQLGMPGEILISAGIEDLPIELSAERLYAKST